MALGAVAASSPALAQSVNDWSLQPDAARSTPTVQGPVDPQNPVARPTTSATPTPAPTPVPTITPPPPPAVATSTPQASPIPRAASSPRPAPTAAQAPSPAPLQAPPTTLAQPVADAPQDSVSAVPSGEEAAPASPAWPIWYWAVPLAAVLVLAGLLLLRRRRPEPPEWDNEPVEAEPLAPELSAQPPAELETAPLPVLPTPPAPAFAPLPSAAAAPTAAPAQPCEIAFEPVSLRLSLVYATLQYRLRLDAATDLADAQLLGDMISAHGSIPPEQQLAPPIDALPRLHSVAALPAGESVVLSGQLMLPLSAILALQRGNARFFVPLVRLCLISGGLAVRRVLTIGEPGSGPALAPFRLDTGPRDYALIDAREVAAAREFDAVPLDPRRAAG